MRREIEIRLRDSSLRVTEQRLAVIEAVEYEGKHQDAEFIVCAARKRFPSLSRQAVFDNLNTLTSKGILRRIEPAGRPALYETRVGDNHHHLVCRNCMSTVDIDCSVGSSPCLQPLSDHGYVIDEAEVVYWGVCPTCQLSN